MIKKKKSRRLRKTIQKRKPKRSNKIKNLNTYVDGGMNIEMYTKEGCPYCERAKEFLILYKPKIKEYDSLSDKERDKIQQRIIKQTGKEYSMYPKIFINNNFIGGYSDLLNKYSHLNQTFRIEPQKWSFF